MNALTTIETTDVAQRQQHFDLSPRSFEQALTFSQYLADSELVPKDFRGKPANCLIALQWGAEIGLKPLQAIQNLAVINGRPALWGDAVIAVVRSSPVCEYVIETQTATEATCRVKRRGEPEQERTFSQDDAKRAGLIGKPGPWTQYPKRMMQMRARAFAMRDVFPDVLRGLPVAEEVMDIPHDIGEAQAVHDAKPQQSHQKGQQQAFTQELMDKAQTAAEAGIAAYSEFWKAASVDDRRALKNDHQRLKDIASAADAQRTVDSGPEVTFDEILEAMCSAKNVDELYLAMGQKAAGITPEQSAILDGKFEELKAQLEKVSA